MISDEMVKYVAALAKIDVDADHIDALKKDLNDIVGYIDTMNELDTENIEPLSHAFKVTNVYREDVLMQSDTKLLLSNAPKIKDGCFLVPQTFE